MEYRTAKIAVAAVLWTVAATLAIIGTIVDTRLLGWGILAALVGCAVTEHIINQTIIHDERLRVEDLLDGLVAKAAERAANAAVERIH